MANYQLYRTNVLLGGQMKYDLVLEPSKDSLEVVDFQITPISYKVPYNLYRYENTFKYAHQENIAKYYQQISGSFYKDFADPRLTNLYPIDIKGTLHESTYEMGCRRAKTYDRYKKQFEFFCPVWLEDTSKNIEFRFTVCHDKDHSKILGRKTLKLTEATGELTEATGELTEATGEFHNRFVEYFDNYTKWLGEDLDWVIDLGKNMSYVTGVDVSSGELVTKKLPNLFDNITDRERPVLETDNMFINTLRDNRLIAKQLFNFNLCFNVSDLLAEVQSKDFIGKSLYVTLDVYCDGEELKKVDFYSNYEYIPRDSIIYTIENTDGELIKKQLGSETNVLDYNEDYKYIDLINKNKIVQSTIHWNLTGYPEYIVNFYKGFGANVNGGLSIYNQNTPNIAAEKYSSAQNQYWLNAYEIDFSSNKDWLIWRDINNYPDKYKYLFSKFSKDSTVNNIKYSVNNDTYALLLIDISNSVAAATYERCVKVNDYSYNILVMRKSDIYGDKSDENNYLPLKKFINTEVEALKAKWVGLLDILKTGIYSGENILLKTGLIPNRTNGPDLNVTEIEYVKDKQSKNISRVLGKMAPMFVDENSRYKNLVYYKGKKDEEKEIYKSSIYNLTNYPPKYPSIGYWNLKDEDERYSGIEDVDKVKESHKFIENIIIDLIPEIRLDFESTEIDVDKKVKETIESKYPEHIRDWALSKYDYKYDEELLRIVKNEENGPYNHEYRYNIEIKLK